MGLIIYLDGLPASGKSTFAKLIKYKMQQDSILLSSDQYAKDNKIGYYLAAKECLIKAIKLAEQGKLVIFDSFVVESYFNFVRSNQLSSSIKFILVGVWCIKNTLIKRFLERENIVSGATYSRIVEIINRDYTERYGDKNPEEIRVNAGEFQLGDNLVKYDLFFDTEFFTPDKMLSFLCEKIKATYLDQDNNRLRFLV